MVTVRLLEAHARAVLQMDVDWHVYEWRAERHPADRTQLMSYRVRGCVCPLLTRGPRRGQPNVRKPVHGTDRTVSFTPQDHEAWEVAWEQRTGQCRACLGDGTTLVRWSVQGGRETRPCPRCAGTGTAPQAQEVQS